MTRYNIINGQRVQFTEEQEREWDEYERQAPAQILALESEQVREKRDALLTKTDWMANSDVTMSDEWRTYRAALRDVPAQAGFPTSVTWPIEPS